MTQRPPIIEKYWYSIDWDVEAIWALDLPVRPMPVTDLIWHLDVPIWPHDGQPYAITPAQVMAAPDKHTVEFARIIRADLGFPIDVIRHKDRWMILDGVHRLSRAVTSGMNLVSVREVPPSGVRRRL